MDPAAVFRKLAGLQWSTTCGLVLTVVAVGYGLLVSVWVGSAGPPLFKILYVESVAEFGVLYYVVASGVWWTLMVRGDIAAKSGRRGAVAAALVIPAVACGLSYLLGIKGIYDLSGVADGSLRLTVLHPAWLLMLVNVCLGGFLTGVGATRVLSREFRSHVRAES